MNRIIQLLIFIFFLTGTRNLLAQKRDLPWAVPLNDKGLPSYKGFYRFSGFTAGEVVFRNGHTATARLNYNISLDEMQFINPQGDTLAIADPGNIHFVNLNGSRFYYNDGYLQAVDTVSGTILASRQVLMAEHRRAETYNTMLTADEKIVRDSLFTGNGQKYNQESDGQSLTSKEHFFFGDGKGGFVKAGKEYILQRYDKNRAAIKEFLRTNHINFNKRQDILLLLQFCSQLK